jgi:hypothetical protein
VEELRVLLTPHANAEGPTIRLRHSTANNGHSEIVRFNLTLARGLRLRQVAARLPPCPPLSGLPRPGVRRCMRRWTL